MSNQVTKKIQSLLPERKGDPFRIESCCVCVCVWYISNLLYTFAENCWFCGEPGHFKSDCPKRPNSICDKCHKVGLGAIQCDNRKRVRDPSLEKGKRGKATVSRFVMQVCVVAVLLMPLWIVSLVYYAAHAVKSGTRPANVATSTSADRRRRLLCHLVRLLRARSSRNPVESRRMASLIVSSSGSTTFSTML
jgi:hypothetical protein